LKAYLQKLCDTAESPLIARQLVREYLQARILESLQRAGAMRTLAFHGGTALRFLYDIPRFSEDLDFALEHAPEAYDFRAYLRQIKRDFSAEAYALEFKVNEKGVVQSAFVRFQGLLHELGLSGHETEVTAIRLEIDTNPPPGAVVTTTSLRRHVRLNLHHHDRASLLAGKLHAVLQRVYPKGRDIFDLWWYLSQPEWPEPNLIQLNNELAQSGWTGPTLSVDNWRNFVQEPVERLNWQDEVTRDIQAFIFDSDWEEHLSKESLISLLVRPN
jgi:predicted nucleotidyltransferase component of viral defense system